MQVHDIFSLPIFELEIPEMHQYHDELLDFFENEIKQKKLTPHQNGFGYQTGLDLFNPERYPFPCLREIVGRTFNQTCLSILKNVRIDSKSNVNWANTMIQGWATMQTNETWENNAWHTHLPATLSGCYYVNVPDNEEEGNFHIKNPGASNIFQPSEIFMRPKNGHMLIFPSFLNHRPSLSPSNTGKIRLAFCMDGYYSLVPGQPHQPGHQQQKQTPVRSGA